MLELGVAVAHVMEVMMRVWAAEGIVMTVELEEDVKSPIALRFGKLLGGAAIKAGKIIKEVTEMSINGAGVAEATMKLDAEIRVLLAMVKVGRDEAGEGAGPGMLKGLFHAFSTGAKDLGQLQPLTPLALLRITFREVNPGPYLLVGIGLHRDGVLPSEIDGG